MTYRKYEFADGYKIWKRGYSLKWLSLNIIQHGKLIKEVEW